jgi:hypothetical protein
MPTPPSTVTTPARPTPALSRLAVTLRRVIDTEPPYDDSAAGAGAAARASAPSTDGALALSVPFRVDEPVAPELPPLRLVPTEPDLEDEEFEVVRTGRQGLPAPQGRAVVLVRAILEALAGDRPLTQLSRWVSEDVYADIESTVCPGTPRTWAATVRRVIVTEPADGVAEVAAVIQRGLRSTALALRLEGLDGRWVVTALHLG